MAFFVLNCKIKIGVYETSSLHDVEIRRSIHSLIDTAKIKIPTSARLRQADGFTANSVETATVFHEGDAVSIQLGYDNNLQQEFTGFVKRVNFTTPLEIECEGYSWQLKNKTGIVKSWRSASTTEILENIIAGTDIVLHPDNDRYKDNVTPFYIKNKNGLEAIAELQKTKPYGGYFTGNQLFYGLSELSKLDKSVVYRIGYNTIKSDSLKYRRAEDVKVKVRAKYKDKKGRIQVKEFGEDGGNEYNIEFGQVEDFSKMGEQALSKAAEFRYEGYEGTITTFIQPYAGPGYKAILIDDKYPERSGEFIIESTIVTFGLNGARRMVELGKKVSKQK